MEVSLPHTWKSQTIDKYNDSGDLDEHVGAYVTQVSLYTMDYALICRVFPTSLKGAALNWFTRFLPLTIDCFDTLMSKFSTQFATSIPHHLTSLALVNIQQKKPKTL